MGQLVLQRYEKIENSGTFLATRNATFVALCEWGVTRAIQVLVTCNATFFA